MIHNQRNPLHPAVYARCHWYLFLFYLFLMYRLPLGASCVRSCRRLKRRNKMNQSKGRYFFGSKWAHSKPIAFLLVLTMVLGTVFAAPMLSSANEQDPASSGDVSTLVTPYDPPKIIVLRAEIDGKCELVIGAERLYWRILDDTPAEEIGPNYLRTIFQRSSGWADPELEWLPFESGAFQVGKTPSHPMDELRSVAIAAQEVCANDYFSGLYGQDLGDDWSFYQTPQVSGRGISQVVQPQRSTAPGIECMFGGVIIDDTAFPGTSTYEIALQIKSESPATRTWTAMPQTTEGSGPQPFDGDWSVYMGAPEGTPNFMEIGNGAELKLPGQVLNGLPEQLFFKPNIMEGQGQYQAPPRMLVPTTQHPGGMYDFDQWGISDFGSYMGYRNFFSYPIVKKSDVSYTVNIRAYIAGRSELIIKDGEIYWQHISGPKPGMMGFVVNSDDTGDLPTFGTTDQNYYPTYVNEQEWWPWEGEESNVSSSLPLHQLGIGVGEKWEVLAAYPMTGNSDMWWTSKPTAENEYTCRIPFNVYNAWMWHEIQLLIKTGENRTVTLEVKDEEGVGINDGYTIQWYEQGSDVILSTGNDLNIPDASNMEYEYAIILGEGLGRQYIEPTRAALELEEGQDTVSIQLDKIPIVEVSGKVTDEDGNPLADATVSLEQQANGRFLVTQGAVTDADGAFALAALQADSILTASKEGYINAQVKDAVTSKSALSVDLGEIILYPFGDKHILLDISGREAAVGSNGAAYGIYSFANLDFSLRNVTQGRVIKSAIIQYPWLILRGETLHEGDEIEIVVADRRDRMASAPVTVALDKWLNANAKIQFVDHGMFTVAAPGDSRAMVFDASGAFVASRAFQGGFQSEPLPAGAYSVVLMEATEFVKKVPILGTLADFGLVEGSDYLKIDAAIEDGKVTELGEVVVPALAPGKLSYTKSSSFTTNKQNLTVNDTYVSYRLDYAIDDKYAAYDESISVEFSQGVLIKEGTVTLDGLKVPYHYEDGKLTVDARLKSGILRFSVVPQQASQFVAAAALGFTLDGDRLVQPLGDATVGITPIDINVPGRTCLTNPAISGYAASGAAITVYDNGKVIAQAAANRSGFWEVKAPLYKPYGFSMHDIYAEATLDSGLIFKSEEKTLDYNETYTALSKVTMIYGNPSYENKYVFDFINPSASNYYSYNPVYPTFTFVVEFLNPSMVSDDVAVIVVGANGETMRVPTTYSEAHQGWVGRADFDTVRRPSKVGVSYSPNADAVQFHQLEEQVQDVSDRIDQFYSDFFSSEDSIPAYIEGMEEILEEESLMPQFEVEQVVDGVEYGIQTISAPGIGLSTAKTSPLPASTTKQDLLNQGFKELPGADGLGGLWYRNDASGISIADYDNGWVKQYALAVGMLGGLSIPADGSQFQADSANWQVETAVNFARQLMNAAEARADKARQMVNAVKQALLQSLDPLGVQKQAAATLDEINESIRTVKLSMSRLEDLSYMFFMMKEMDPKLPGCAGTIASLGSEMAFEIQFLALYTAWESYGLYGMLSGPFSIHKIFKKLGGKGLLDVVKGGKVWKWFRTVLKVPEVREEIGSRAIDVAAEIAFELNEVTRIKDYYTVKDAYRRCLDLCEEKEGEEIEPANSQPATGAIDPSGYVYEAVLSNRLPGVTASAYFRPMGSEETEQGTFWDDAADFGQSNPLLTDAIGYYAWDVPEAMWQVKYEKDGYETAFSEWMPVPPPQLDVNIGLVSKAAPTVSRVNAYADGIDIAFSKYMKPESFSGSTVRVLNGGSEIAGALAAVDLENGLASLYRFVPNAGIPLNTDIEIVIGASAESYAGTPLGQEYRTTANVQLRPEKITTDSLTLAFGTSAPLKATVEPGAAAAGKKLLITAHSPSLAGAPTEIPIDGNGIAQFSVNALLPGTAYFTASVEGTGLSHQFSVEIVMAMDGGDPDGDAVNAAKGALTWNAIRQMNERQDAVTANLALPTVGAEGTAIKWVSGNPSVIGADGKVQRPVYAAGDANVTLTATISKGSATATVSFSLTVLKQAKPDDPGKPEDNKPDPGKPGDSTNPPSSSGNTDSNSQASGANQNSPGRGGSNTGGSSTLDSLVNIGGTDAGNGLDAGTGSTPGDGPSGIAESAPPLADDPVDSDSPSASGGFPWWVIVLIGGIILAGALVFVLRTRKQRPPV